MQAFSEEQAACVVLAACSTGSSIPTCSLSAQGRPSRSTMRWHRHFCSAGNTSERAEKLSFEACSICFSDLDLLTMPHLVAEGCARLPLRKRRARTGYFNASLRGWRSDRALHPPQSSVVVLANASKGPASYLLLHLHTTCGPPTPRTRLGNKAEPLLKPDPTLLMGG